jgi:hypothetical protein
MSARDDPTAAAPLADGAARVAALAQRLDGVFVAIAAIAAAVALGQLVAARGRPATLVVAAAVALLALGARGLAPAIRVSLLSALLPIAFLTFAANGVAFWLEQRERGGDDPRSMADAVRDYRAQGLVDAVPPSKAWAYLEEPLVVDGVPTVPLSGLPLGREVLCNEGGSWRTYATDRMGFTNPDALWDAPADLVLVGDSFTQGFCVPPEQSFAGRIRAVHPATLNFGGNANGPLVELGTLVEFQPRARAHTVLWFFYEANDFDDLLGEARQAILRAYLEPGGSQRLLDRLPAVHAAQRESAERRMDDWGVAAPRPGAWYELVRFAKLGHLRKRFDVLRDSSRHRYETIDASAVESTLPRVVSRMADEAQSSGARLLLVYLPGRDAFTQRGHHPQRPLLLDAAREAGIASLDLTGEFAAAAPDPTRFYSRRQSWSHLTPEGNRVVADAVLAALAERGWASRASD